MLGIGTLALVAGAALIAWKYTVCPLEEREARIAREFADLGERLGEARRSIEEVQALDQQSRSTAVELAELHRGNPAGPALVWLPVRVKEQFQRFKIADVTMRVNTIRNDPKLPGYTRIVWATEMPVERTTRDIANALFAILGIEADVPFVRVLNITIGPDPADSSRHVAVAEIALLAPEQSTRPRYPEGEVMAYPITASLIRRPAATMWPECDR